MGGTGDIHPPMGSYACVCVIQFVGFGIKIHNEIIMKREKEISVFSIIV